MRKTLHLLIFVLALSLTYAGAQSSGSTPAPGQKQPPASTNQTTPPSTTTPTTPDTQSTPGINSESNSDLQGQIQNALKNEPTLANASINVRVTDDQIDLAGTVATAREKLTAKRIAQSYAGNRKVKERITLGATSPK
jgi:BRCT domain type II-containing protein